MKIPKAKHLPSGRWNINIMVNGQRISVTADTEREVIAKAAAIKAGMMEQERPASMTLSRAIDRYIESKDGILSPATIAGYRRIQRNAFPDLMRRSLGQLTPEQIQRAVNTMAKTHSPKSVANAHGLVSAVLKEYRPTLRLRTTLPQKERKEIKIPSEPEIAAILEAAKGKKVELPILLALYLGLRASEICGLTRDCIQGDTICIKSAVVTGEHGKQERKGPKTAAGYRMLKVPPQIMEKIMEVAEDQEVIVDMTGHAIYNAFVRVCEKAGVPHYRFHDLRHASASYALLANEPLYYVQRRMGHSTDNMLKKVYLHVSQDKAQDYAQRTYDYLDKLQMKLQTDDEEH